MTKEKEPFPWGKQIKENVIYTAKIMGILTVFAAVNVAIIYPLVMICLHFGVNGLWVIIPVIFIISVCSSLFMDYLEWRSSK